MKLEISAPSNKSICSILAGKLAELSSLTKLELILDGEPFFQCSQEDLLNFNLLLDKSSKTISVLSLVNTRTKYISKDNFILFIQQLPSSINKVIFSSDDLKKFGDPSELVKSIGAKASIIEFTNLDEYSREFISTPKVKQSLEPVPPPLSPLPSSSPFRAYRGALFSRVTPSAADVTETYLTSGSTDTHDLR